MRPWGEKYAQTRLRACRCGDRLVRNDGQGAGRRRAGPSCGCTAVIEIAQPCPPVVQSYLVNQGPVLAGPGHYLGQLEDAAPCCYPYVGFVYSGYPYGAYGPGGYPRGFYNPYIGYPYADPPPYIHYRQGGARHWRPYRRAYSRHW